MKIVAISDQHGTWPTIPACDLLIVAGDQCIDNFGPLQARHFPDRQWQWFRDKWLPWRYKKAADECLLTWGNHDHCGVDHQNHRSSLNGRFTTIACDSVVEVKGLKVWLSPWTPPFMNWAFMAPESKLAEIYAEIPVGIDILVSHGPPHGCGDGFRYYDIGGSGREGEHHFGSYALREAIRRVKPKAVVCGHIHAGYGRYELDGIPVYNVSVVNEAYLMMNQATEIEL